MVTETQVLDLLRSQFFPSVTDLMPVEGGAVARTFAFRANEQDYIVRFNLDKMLASNFPKEAYLWQKLASTQIPMPPVMQVGRLGELHFAISRRMPGKMLFHFTPPEIAQMFPQLMEILDAIHAVDVSDTQGYGVFNDRGQGMTASWHTFLKRIADEEDEHDYYGKWHHLFEATFLEREVFDQIYQRMLRLLEACPEERFLVHGSLSLANLLALEVKLTAVLDWLDARYGDFVYDIAILDYWTPSLGVAAYFQHHCQERQIVVPDYQERILCYQCYVSLDAIRFYAKSGQEKSYQTVRARILEKLE